jgi:ABC-type branched-subunit amino acid transport system substrate-binding protein
MSRPAVLALALTLAACTERGQEGSGVRGVEPEVIRVGTYGPLTGPQAAWGDALRGMKAYFRWINHQGGVHGRKLELYVKDDGYDPSRTPRVVRALVERDEVFAVVGGIGTAPGRAAAPLLERAGVPFFTPASGAQWFSSPEGPENVRTVYLPYHAEGRIIGDHVVRSLGLERVAVVHQDDDFGLEGKAGVKAGVEEAGGALVASASVLPTDTDVSGAVGAVLEASPDALVLYLAPRQAVLVGRRLASEKTRPQLVTSFVLNDPGIIERAGREVWEGTLSAAVSRLADEDHPAVAQYETVLSDFAPSLAPGGFAMSGVRFAQPFVEALHRAGRDLTPARFYEALATLDDYAGGGPYWQGEGLGAPVDFTGGKKLGVDQVGFARAEGGEWVRVGDWREAPSGSRDRPSPPARAR